MAKCDKERETRVGEKSGLERLQGATGKLPQKLHYPLFIIKLDILRKWQPHTVNKVILDSSAELVTSHIWAVQGQRALFLVPARQKLRNIPLHVRKS